MNEGRNQKSQQKSRQWIICYFLHKFFERAGGTLLQTISHQPHTVKKQRKSAEERDKIEDIHNVFAFLLRFCSPL